MSNNAHSFTWGHYRCILTAGLDSGYHFVGFGEEVDGKRILLRHDIDNDIGIAHRMATIEHDMGVKATYLVLLRSSNYNPAEGGVLHMLEEMAEMGHDIGLHFSLVDHPARRRRHDLAALIRRDADLLAMLLERPVSVFSFHNPTDGGQFRVEVPGLINAYATPFFQDAYYTSESNMQWRKGCPCEVLPRDGHKVVQMLVHPLSFADTLASDRDVLLHFMGLKLKELLDYNVMQNRGLREIGLPMREVLGHLGAREDVQ